MPLLQNAPQLTQSVSDRLQLDPTPTRSDSRIAHDVATVITPVMTDDDLRRLVDDFVHSVQHDIASLRAQYVTRRQAVKLSHPVRTEPSMNTSLMIEDIISITPGEGNKRSRQNILLTITTITMIMMTTFMMNMQRTIVSMSLILTIMKP